MAFSVCYKNGISINRQNGFDPNADPYGEITGQHNAVQGSNVVKQKRDKQQLADAKAAYLRTDCSSYPRGRWFKFSPRDHQRPEIVRLQDVFCAYAT